MPRIPFSEYLSAHRALKNEVSAYLFMTLPEIDADGKPIPQAVTGRTSFELPADMPDDKTGA